MKTATRLRLNERLEIRVVSAPAFVATKLEAFVSRGPGDFLSSHDFEDVLNVVDGRPSLIDEMPTSSPELLKFVRECLRKVLATPHVEDRLPGLLTDEGRMNVVLSRLRTMAA